MPATYRATLYLNENTSLKSFYLVTAEFNGEVSRQHTLTSFHPRVAYPCFQGGAETPEIS